MASSGASVSAAASSSTWRPSRSAGEAAAAPERSEPARSWISRTVQAWIGLTIASASHSGSASSALATEPAFAFAAFPAGVFFGPAAACAGGTAPPSVIDSSTAISAMPSAMQ